MLAQDNQNGEINPVQSELPIELYAFPTSPYAIKVGCYLSYLHLDYQFVGVSPITFKQIEFSGKRQVPVLKIGEEWKLDSHVIGLWIEEKYTDSGLLGSSRSDREEIVALDNWVSHRMIPHLFRVLVDWPSIHTGLTNGWKLAKAVHRATPIPRWVRWMWPVFLRKAKFIVALADSTDRQESLEKSQDNVIREFIDLLDGGPYLGGRAHPTLADLSAFATMTFPYRFGLLGDAKWFEHDLVLNWIWAVQKHLPDNPYLVDSAYLPKQLPVIQN